ncbi:protein translocase subunit SecD [Candidatus Spongiihabitans sp.]|uniref:protein translocase subunit SecD n=1 Tax=Candidatus Spongiihabitans sp. TaxID=3101308 RepID=UPI003C79CE89
MFNQTAWWKFMVIITVVLFGLIYAAPNIFGSDPGIQIRGARGLSVESAVLGRVQSTLDAQSISFKSISRDAKGIKIRFENDEAQLRAKELIEKELGNNYSSALTLLTGAPSWLTELGVLPMYLGLDLRGGVHFLLQVDMQSAVKRAQERYQDNIKTILRENKLRYRTVLLNPQGQLETTIRNPDHWQQAYDILIKELPDLEISDDDSRAEIILAQLSQTQTDEIKKFALEQNLTALRNRVDQLGVAEPVVQQQGDDRIVIQLPGVQDTARAKAILGRAATLEMHLVDEKNNTSAIASGQAPSGSRIFKFRDGRRILLHKRVIYSGDSIVDAAASLDAQTGGPIVSITLDSAAATINSRVTGENINNRMAVVYLEITSAIKKDADGNIVLGDDGKPVRVTNRLEEVLTAPVIRDQLGKRYQIEGLDSVEEARDLSLMLRSGTLAAPVEIIEERTVGPSLGQANISQGFRSVMVGFVLVLIFMLVYYRVFGFTAILALTLNLVLIVAVLSLLQATLTLPGVAGIVLTVGMAVDANVLIFERIREEVRNGNSPQASIYLGYDRALSTIVDANITTLIAAVVLFNFGTGPIKGFAVTLSIGIITSMFTAIMLTRMLINLFYGGKIVKRLAI